MRPYLQNRQCKTLLASLAVLFFSQAVAQPLEDLDGRVQFTASASDRWLLINYWALWCAPCRSEIPELNALALSHPEIQVLGVNFDQPDLLSDAKAAKATLGIEFPVLRQSPHQFFGQPIPAGLPATDLISPEGVHRVRLFGPQTREGLLEQIEQLKQQKRKSNNE